MTEINGLKTKIENSLCVPLSSSSSLTSLLSSANSASLHSLYYPRVCVIGGGIIGLCTATILQEKYPGIKVTIIAEHFLEGTTSIGAAGIFRPGQAFSGPTYEITIKWLKDSYNYYRSILDHGKELALAAGIKEISGFFISRKDPLIAMNRIMNEMNFVHRPCTVEELAKYPGHQFGNYYETILTECTRFLPYLMNKFRLNGGNVIQKKVKSFGELYGSYDLVFNCTAMGARELCNDYKMEPIRGQVFKVYAPWITQFVHSDYNAQIIPGLNHVTIGGVRQFGDFDSAIETLDSKSIWEKILRVMPSIKYAKILQEWVGFRPFRGVVRVEAEEIEIDGKGKLQVIHNYGHGGYGVMSAPGTAKFAVETAADFINSHLATKAKL